MLQQYNADDSTIELIIDNIILYNSLIDDFLKGEKVNKYLMYQLNNQILKQIESVKKFNIKLIETEQEEDEFIKTIKSIGNMQHQMPVNYAVVNKDSEKRNVE